MERLLILLCILISLLPVFYLNTWLQNLILPRKSFGRLILYFLVMVELIFIYTYLLVLFIAKMFPLPK